MQAYEVDLNGWTWVPVQDILQQAEGSCDFDEINWEYIIQEKSEDTGFLHLLFKIQEEGWLSAIGWRDRYITEGHHRLVAAILLCEDLIPTTEYGTSLYSKDGHSGYQSGHSHHKDQEPAPLYFEEFDY